MIKLGDLVLPEDLILEGEFEWVPVRAETGRTLGGRLVVWEDRIEGGRPLDLVATEASGWLSRAQAEALREMASEPGATYTLLCGPDGQEKSFTVRFRHQEKSFTVRFRHEDAPVLELWPVVPRPFYEPGDLYYGRIKLMEVG